MRDNDLRKLFREQESAFDRAKAKERMSGIEAAIHDKQIVYRPRKAEILRIQLRYMEKSYWIIQSLLLVFVLSVFAVYGRAGGAWLGERQLFAFGACAAAFIGMGGMLGLERLMSFHMRELTSTMYFNFGQLVSIRMVISGVVDLLFLMLLSFGVAYYVQTSAYTVAVYLLIPFVLSNLFYFAVFSLVRERGRTIAFVAVAVFSCVAGWRASEAAARYMRGSTWKAAALAAVAAAVLFVEIKCVLTQIRQEAV